LGIKGNYDIIYNKAAIEEIIYDIRKV